MATAKSDIVRREPKQNRSRQTVDAVLEGVQLVVRRHGPQSITTNRIAEAAGVSIGSLYQYFPNKRAIFTALHERHVDEVRLVIEQTMAARASGPLDVFAGELVQGLMNVHAEVADLHVVVSSAMPETGLGFSEALHHTFAEVLSCADRDRYNSDETTRMLFVLPRMVESLVHGSTHQGRVALSRNGAESEVVRTVQVYVNSFRRTTSKHY